MTRWPIEPLEWTAIERYAVRTRSILAASQVVADLNRRRDPRAHGRCRGVQFMLLRLFERRLQGDE